MQTRQRPHPIGTSSTAAVDCSTDVNFLVNNNNNNNNNNTNIIIIIALYLVTRRQNFFRKYQLQVSAYVRRRKGKFCWSSCVCVFHRPSRITISNWSLSSSRFTCVCWCVTLWRNRCDAYAPYVGHRLHHELEPEVTASVVYTCIGIERNCCQWICGTRSITITITPHSSATLTLSLSLSLSLSFTHASPQQNQVHVCEGIENSMTV